MQAQTMESTDRWSDPMEHRWGQRVTLELPVTLHVFGRALGRGVLRNASISGGLIQTAVELPTFTHLVVKMPTLSEATSGANELVANVVRPAPGGFAVEWRDMACPAIVTLLERFSGQPGSRLLEDEAFTKRKGTC
jgi:hypothetical protein